MPRSAPKFDRYLIVDWSAANAPKRGRDSIWIGEAVRAGERIRVLSPRNIPTRTEAIAQLERKARRAISLGERLIIGLDFAFGYPAGAARYLGGTARWHALWSAFAAEVEDDAENRSNRFDLAARWNREKLPCPMFWGHPTGRIYDGLTPTRPMDFPADAPKMFRIVESWQRPAKSVWQLAYQGAVGAQSILGIARLEKLRRGLGPQAAIWPFETGFVKTLGAPVMFAEVYPSMFPINSRRNEVKDAAQVRAVVKIFAYLDRNGKLFPLLDAPPQLSSADRKKVLCEEGWIVGAGHAIEL